MIEIVRAALKEAGYVKEASLIKNSADGIPEFYLVDTTKENFPVILKAFHLAHLSMGHDTYLCESKISGCNFIGERFGLAPVHLHCKECFPDFWEVCK